jgi:hypothetical protein
VAGAVVGILLAVVAITIVAILLFFFIYRGRRGGTYTPVSGSSSQPKYDAI